MPKYENIYNNKYKEVTTENETKLQQFLEENPDKKEEIKIKNFIIILRFFNNQTLLANAIPQDPFAKGWNNKENPCKKHFLDIYNKHIDSYLKNKIDNLVTDYLASAVDYERESLENDPNYSEWKDQFNDNITIESTIEFLAEYQANKDFIQQLYNERKRKVGLNEHDHELIFQPIKLNNKEHLTDLNSTQQMALWTLLSDQGLFIKDKNRLPIKKISLLFNQLTGYSASQFQGKRLKAVERLSQLEKNKIIRILEEIIISLKNA